MSVGGGSGVDGFSIIRRISVRKSTGGAAGAGCDGSAIRCSIGVAIRALATSVRRPTWLCHQPDQAIAPCQ